MNGRDHQGRTALASLYRDPRDHADLGQPGLGFGRCHKAHRHPDHQGRAHPLLLDQTHDLEQGGRGIADADDASVQKTLTIGLAHRLLGTGGLVREGRGDHIPIRDELIGPETKALEPCLGQARRDHCDIRDQGAITPAYGRQTAVDRVRMEGGQAVQLEVGTGVNHPPHDRPLARIVAVGTRLGVDDGEGVMLDRPPGAGVLLGIGGD